MGDLVKDTTELDLWAFDDLDSGDDDAKPASRAVAPGIPVPRESGKKKPPEAAESFAPRPQAQPSIRVNVSKDRPSPASAQKPVQPKPPSEFDDLDHWDEPAAWAEPVAPEPPTLAIHPSFSSPPQEPFEEPENPQPAAASTPEAIDEFSPAPRANSTPVSLVPHLGLSKIERLGLAVLVGLLLIGGGVVFFHTSCGCRPKPNGSKPATSRSRAATLKSFPPTRSGARRSAKGPASRLSAAAPSCCRWSPSPSPPAPVRSACSSATTKAR